MVNHSGFPEQAFAIHKINVNETRPDDGLDIFLSMLVAAYYPNICYLKDHRRRVYTLEQATALLRHLQLYLAFYKFKFFI